MAVRKRELEAAADHFDKKEREAMRRKLEKMDAEEALTLLPSARGKKSPH